MKRVRLGILVAMVLGVVAPLAVRAEEPQCPLEVGACLAAYQGTRDRPWLGVNVEMDSVTQRPRILKVMPGSPADKAKLKPGDIIRSIDGQVPRDWFAGKAGWKADAVALDLDVIRRGQPLAVDVRAVRISEEMLAKVIGVHMLEGHLAYLPDHRHTTGQ